MTAPAVGTPYSSALETRLAAHLKQCFGSAPFPLSDGLVAVVANTRRGLTADFYLDAPGAGSLSALTDYAALSTAATPYYTDELARIAATPGVSIWNEGEILRIGTTGNGGAVSAGGQADLMTPAEAVDYWSKMYANAEIVTKYAGAVKPVVRYKADLTYSYPFPLQSNTNSADWDPFSILYAALMARTNGRIALEWVASASLATLESLCRPGKMIVVQHTTIGTGAPFPASPSGAADSLFEGLLNVPIASSAVDATATSGNIFYCGFITDAPAKAAPLYVLNRLNTAFVPLTLDVVATLAPRFQARTWESLTTRVVARSSPLGWESLRDLFPTEYATTVPFGADSSPGVFSPVRALPQIFGNCGLDTLVISTHVDSVTHYQKVMHGINVKVIIVGDHDLHVSAPLAWVKKEGLRGKMLSEAGAASVDALITENGDVGVSLVAYHDPVRLPQNLVSMTEMARKHKKFREKNCKVDDFLEQRFNEYHTYGSLQTKINGSLSTPEFYGVVDRLAPLLKPVVPISNATGSIVAVKTSGIITTVAVTGNRAETNATYAAPAPQIGEAYTAGYTLSGCTAVELATWLGVSSLELESARTDAREMTGAVAQTGKAAGKRESAYGFNDYLIAFGAFPDYKVVSSLNTDAGYRLAMSSKGAIVCGPAVATILHNSRRL